MSYATAVMQRSTTEQHAAEQAIQAVVLRSTTDRAFREQLLTNPRGAIAAFVGKSERDLPADLQFAFVENTATATIVLPDPVNADLTDSELESVAGGTGVETICGIIALGMFIYDTAEKIYNAGQTAGATPQ